MSSCAQDSRNEHARSASRDARTNGTTRAPEVRGRITSEPRLLRTYTGLPPKGPTMTQLNTTLRTPYHALGDDHVPRVPSWAERRSVYRGEGRTVYVVETTCLDLARRDLRRLAKSGWDVAVEKGSGQSQARIALTQGELAHVA